jgi:hypothetical protein
VPSIEDLVHAARRSVRPDYEAALRAHLEQQDKAWLVEQLVRLSLDPRQRAERDAQAAAADDAVERAARQERLRAIDLDEGQLQAFVDAFREHDRERLVADGHLDVAAPEPGTAVVGDEHRSESGAALLQQAKDLLFAVLFGDQSTDSRLVRRERELLTMVLPRHKAFALDFLQATTELDADGTWKDPEAVSDDARADNVVLEVEFGEVEGELAGQGVLVALALINHLEVNEQILYARMTNIEESSLS